MANRERIEDLGRISERLHTLLKENELLFDMTEKNLIEILNTDPNWIEKFCLNMKQMGHELDDIWCIARFGDDEDGIDSIYSNREKEDEFEGVPDDSDF